MRTASAVVGTVLVLASALGAIAPPLRVAREPLQVQTAEQELRVLNEGWSKALIARDHGWFERHIADEYLAIDPDGVLWTKPELLDSLKSVDLAVAPHVMDEIRVRAYGNVGVVFGRSTATSRRRESTIGQWRYTHVWVKRNARWACVAAHMSKVASV
jgi:ketosteroid isomerase-like protein